MPSRPDDPVRNWTRPTGWGVLVVVLLLAAELAAAPLASSRLQAAFSSCGVEAASIDLGSRPHLWSLVTGRVRDVRIDLNGLRIGPLRIAEIQAHVDEIHFARRILVGLSAPFEVRSGTASATVTEVDLDEVVTIPLTSVRIDPDGVIVVVLGIPVPLIVQPAAGRVELRVIDESLPPIRIDLPESVEVTEVQPGSGILTVQANLTGSLSPGALSC